MQATAFNTRLRGSTISKVFLDKTIRVYNGLTLKSFFVKGDMVGRKLGEFSISKKLGSAIVQPRKSIKQRLHSRKKK